jgi:hypothetical protein
MYWEMGKKQVWQGRYKIEKPNYQQYKAVGIANQKKYF